MELDGHHIKSQVHSDFEVYGGAVGLSSCCLYGGSPYRAQEISLKRGVDIVVGTPGRIKVNYLSLASSVFVGFLDFISRLKIFFVLLTGSHREGDS